MWCLCAIFSGWTACKGLKWLGLQVTSLIWMALNHVGLDWLSTRDNLRHKPGCLPTFIKVILLQYRYSFRLLCRCLLIKTTEYHMYWFNPERLKLPRRGIAAEQRRLPTVPQPESKFKSACAAGKREASSVPDADVFRLQRGLRLQRTARHRHDVKTKVEWGWGWGEFFCVYRRKRQLQVVLKCLLGRSWMRTSLPLSMIYLNLAISGEALGSYCSGPKKEEKNRLACTTIKLIAVIYSYSRFARRIT